MLESQIPSLRAEASIPSVLFVTLWLNESCSFTGKTHAHLFSFIAVVVKLLSCVQLFVTHGLQHTRLPCPSPSPRICSNSCRLSWWCHLTISSSVIPFSCLQSFLVSGSFPMSQFFTSDGQNIGVSASASVLSMNSQDWFPVGWTGSSLCSPRDC